MPVDNDSAQRSTEPQQDLASLLRLGLEARHAWRAEELAAALQYHLKAPLEFDLGSFRPGQARQLRDLAGAQGLLLKSLDDLFQHPLPPPELLREVKDFAKSCIHAVDAPVPKEVARVLYYLSIGCALVRLKQRMSSLSNRELLEGLDQVLGYPWLQRGSRSLLSQARKCVAESTRVGGP